jgi:hypothetical protein
MPAPCAGSRVRPAAQSRHYSASIVLPAGSLFDFNRPLLPTLPVRQDFTLAAFGWLPTAILMSPRETRLPPRSLTGDSLHVRQLAGVRRTNLWQHLSAADREHLYESVGNSLPVGRVGEAEDVAQAYLFLMQEGFSTGQSIRGRWRNGLGLAPQ